MATSFLGRLLYISFQLTIFFLLALELYKLIKEYLLPVLRKQIDLLNKMWQDLQDKLDLTTSTKKTLQKKIKDQGKTLQNLEIKVEKWHTSRAQRQSEQKRREVDIISAMQDKKQKQIESLQRNKINQTVIPKAIKEVQKAFLQKYSGEAGKDLLKKVIKELPKKPN